MTGNRCARFISTGSPPARRRLKPRRHHGNEWNSNHLPAPRLVATADGAMVGWAALSPVSRAPVYAGVAEVSVYVAKTCVARELARRFWKHW